MWGRHHRMWRHQTIDGLPSINRDCSLPPGTSGTFSPCSPERDQSKVSNLLGQDLLPLPFEAMKYLNFLVLWQTHQWFSGMFILPGYRWPWHPIPRSQPSPKDPLTSHPLIHHSLCVAYGFTETAQQSYADVWEADRVALLGQQKNLGHRLWKKVPSLK